MKGKTILVPTDFSRNAEAALKYAIGFAKDFNSHIIILHAYRLLQTAVPSGDQSPFSIKNQWDKDTWEKFRKLEKKLIKGSNISYDFEVDVGFASDAIISSVDANDVKLVIMGSVGAGAMSQVLGSTTLKIIDKINCPVMVVPSDAEYCKVRKIAFAYDNKKIKKPAKLNVLVDYVKKFGAKLEILNINTEDGVSKHNLSLLEQKLSGTDYHYTTIQSENIAEGILNYLKGTSTDMLVALKRDHSFMEKVFGYSVTRKLVLHSELPLLVLHES
jgi:nucleotide-binding universal stress UspA family protein